MDTVPSSLDSFLQHGFLPHVGHGRAMEDLLAFWESTPHSDGLRVLLVSGEAGIGKSRLIDEIMPRLRMAGGVVLRLRLLPEATGGPFAMAGAALSRDEAVQPLLRGRPLDDASDVVSALSRLGRLRATIILLEDLHHLSGPNPAELARLLESLSDESISVIATARPSEGAHRAVVERYLVDQIELPRLDAEAIAELWQNLFSSSPDPASIFALHSATVGNPLALRSVLRGALTSGTIARSGPAHQMVVDTDRFVNSAWRDLARLGEAMAAHLGEDDRRSAQILASLGEVFARETAEALLGETAIATIRRLVDSGIISISNVQASPLPGLSRSVPDHPSSLHPPFVFVHTLLHQHLLQDTHVDLWALAEAAAECPLYSTIPYRLIDAELPAIRGLGAVTARHLFDRIRYAALDTLNYDPSQLRPLLEIARRLASGFESACSEEERRDIQCALISTELSALSYEERMDEYENEANRLLSITGSPATEREAAWRIAAIGKASLNRTSDRQTCRMMWSEMEALVQQFPGVARSHNYVMGIALLALYAGTANDSDMAHAVERRVADLFTEGSSDPFVSFVNRYVAPGLLMVFEDGEELANRRTLFDAMEQEPRERLDRSLFTEKGLQFLDAVGDYDRLMSFADRNLPYIHLRLNPLIHVLARLARLKWQAAMGDDLASISQAGAEIVDALPAEYRDAGRVHFVSAFVHIALLRGELEWSKRFLASNRSDLDLVRPSVRFLAEFDENSRRLPEPVHVDDDALVKDVLRRLIDFDTGAPITVESVVDGVSSLAERAPLSVSYILLHRLVSRFLNRPQFALVESGVHQAMRRWTRRIIGWMIERRFGQFLDTLLKNSERWIDPKDLQDSRARAKSIRSERIAELAEARGADRLFVRVVGTIGIVDQAMRERKPGGRMKAVLGLMAGIELGDSAMDHRDFCKIAAGDDDADRARNVVYVTLHRLREVLGSDSVITEPDAAPRFNLQRVRVDIVEAHRWLVDAAKALQKGNLLRALPLIEKSLDVIASDVPFPGLYEDYFEQARDRIETSLRDLVIRLGKRLVVEDDVAKAEELFRRALQAMPEDEEIEELLDRLHEGKFAARSGGLPQAGLI